MDDKVYITQMELAYKNISNDNVEVNQKAGIMIGIIGVMFSIQSTIIINLYPFTNILSYVIVQLSFALSLFDNLKIIFLSVYYSLFIYYYS